jgi:hypothetical protein
MLMVAAGTTFLAACGVDEARAEPSKQSELTPDKPAPKESVAPEQGASASDTEPAPGEAVTPRVPCRRVTAASVPFFTAPNSNTVACRFFAGDVFSYFNVVQSPGFPARLTSWCPRGVPPAQGTTAYAQIAGTVDGGCGG